MRSVTSWFNGTLFKKNMTRFWPVWGLYLAIWVIVFPVNLILGNHSAQYFAREGILDYMIEMGLPMAVVFSVLAATAVWSYLCNHRSTCLMHTLPIRREGLFLTNYLSGLAFMGLPNVVVFVLTLLAELAVGHVRVSALLVWLVGVTLMEVFFFSFATFCAMFTGHILGIPAFYGILNVLVLGIIGLIDMALSSFVYGFTEIPGAEVAVRLLTPAWAIGNGLNVWSETVNGQTVVHLTGFMGVVVYAVVGLVFAALALVVYRRRDMERAGDVVTVKWVRPVFRYGVAFCCALAFGTLFFEMFQYTLGDTAWTLLVFMLICGAAGYFLAQMLLDKSFRVLRYWKGCVPFLAALVVLVCVMEFDLTGYENRVPERGQVASVSISDLYTFPSDDGSYFGSDDRESTDPEVIAAVLAAHQAIVDQKDEPVWRDRDAWEGTELGYDVQNLTFTSFMVAYTLNDGTTIHRSYNGIPVYADDLDDPDSVTAKLSGLINLYQMVEQNYKLDELKDQPVIDISLSTQTWNEEDGYWFNESMFISEDAYDKVFQAVLTDMEEGNLGRRYLLRDEEYMNTCLVNELKIVFRVAKIKTGQKDTAADVEYEYDTDGVCIALQTTAKHTLAALAEEGVLQKPMALLTEAQMEALTASGDYVPESADLNKYAWDIFGE